MNTKNDISLLENTQIRMLFCFIFKFICSMCMILYAKKIAVFFKDYWKIIFFVFFKYHAAYNFYIQVSL